MNLAYDLISCQGDMTKIWQGEFRYMVIEVLGMHQFKVSCTDSVGDII